MADTSDQAGPPQGDVEQSQGPMAEQLSEVVLRARHLALIVNDASIESRPDVLCQTRLMVTNRLENLRKALAAVGCPQPKKIAIHSIRIADFANRVEAWANTASLQITQGLEYVKYLCALANALEAEIQPPNSSGPDRIRTRTAGIDLESCAIAVLFKEPSLSLADIAVRVGVARNTLYKWPIFRDAAEKAGKLKPRGTKGRPPRRGHKTRDGRIEAYADEDE